MKRSEAIKKLIHKVISPFEVIKSEYYENGLYEERAKQMLEFIENELGMLPPDTKLAYEFDEPYIDCRWEQE